MENKIIIKFIKLSLKHASEKEYDKFISFNYCTNRQPSLDRGFWLTYTRTAQISENGLRPMCAGCAPACGPHAR